MKWPFEILKLITVLILFSACERDIIITGKVIDKVTKQGIEGVHIQVKDGMATSNSLITSNTGAKNFGSTYTDVNGQFKVEIKTSSDIGYIGAMKDGYEMYTIGGTVQQFHFSKVKDMIIEMNGCAYFNAIFQKTSAIPQDNDSLIVSLFYYEWKNEDAYSTLYQGKTPFPYYYIASWTATGGRFLRYKLKYNGGGMWHTKIDSVFLPTSTEIYRDTIYY